MFSVKYLKFRHYLCRFDASSGVRRKNFGGFQGYGKPRRVPENFRKFANNSRRKLQKCRIFAYFAKNFKTMR